MPASAIRSLLADATLAARLRLWIVIVGVLVIVLFVSSSAYDSWRSYRQVITATNRELSNLAKVLAEQAGDTLQTANLLLRDTVGWYESGRPKAGPGAEGKLAARAADLPQVRTVFITDEYGRVRVRSKELGPATADLSQRPYFIAHRDHPGLGVVLSDPLISLEQRPAVVLSRRLDKRDGSFDGIVQVSIDLEEFQRVYGAIDLGPGSAINLLHEDGILVVRQPRPSVTQAVGSRFPELVAAASSPDGLVTKSVDQKPRFVGVARVASFPLVVAVTRQKSVAFASWRADYYRVAARSLVFVLLCGLGTGGLVYQIRRIELGERALRESEGRYALAMEGANEGHFDWDFEHGRSFLSPQMKLLHGRSADAPVTTREAWIAALDIHPDDVDRMETAARDHFEGRTDHYEAEYRVRHADGQWHWLYARGRCFCDGQGKVLRFVGSAIDV